MNMCFGSNWKNLQLKSYSTMRCIEQNSADFTFLFLQFYAFLCVSNYVSLCDFSKLFVKYFLSFQQQQRKNVNFLIYTCSEYKKCINVDTK